MRLRSLVLGAVSVAAAGLLAAPTAAAEEPWPPGNCPQGAFCVWPNWAHPEPAPVEKPSVVTYGEWAGEVAPARTYYNYTSRNVDLEYFYTWPDGSTTSSTNCVRPGGTIFYTPMTVTKLTWHEGSC